MEEEITFHGHKNILSLHYRTIEITKDSKLTKNGDCIVGVSADKACNDLDTGLRQKLMSDSLVEIAIIVEPYEFKLVGFGNKDLRITHKHDIVLRKSNYIDSRTLIVSCDKSAIDIPRNMINALINPETKGLLRIKVE